MVYFACTFAGVIRPNIRLCAASPVFLLSIVPCNLHPSQVDTVDTLIHVPMPID